MKNIEKYNVTKIQNEELVTISGGDIFTEAFSSWLGTIFGSLGSADAAESQHGINANGVSQGWDPASGASGEW